MRASPRHGTTVGFIVLLNTLLLATQAADRILTDHLVVQLHEEAQDNAHQLAAQHGFQSARKVGMVPLHTPHNPLGLSDGGAAGVINVHQTGKHVDQAPRRFSGGSFD